MQNRNHAQSFFIVSPRFEQVSKLVCGFLFMVALVRTLTSDHKFTGFMAECLYALAAYSFGKTFSAAPEHQKWSKVAMTIGLFTMGRFLDQESFIKLPSFEASGPEL